jgi:hypothetical protein
MARAVILVFVLLLAMAYVSLFLAWNARLQPVVTWQMGAQYSQEIPVGLLFIFGVVVGAVAMALALTGPWNALKQSDAQARTLLEKAKAKLRAQDEKVRKLTAQAEAKKTPPEPPAEIAEAPESIVTEEGEPAAAEPSPAEDPEEV